MNGTRPLITGKPILNLHIPKTGGTSLLIMFREAFGKRVIRKNDYPRHPSDYKYKILSGHFPYNPEYWDFNWLSFVRHPIERLESFYRYKQMKLKNRRNASDYWVQFFRGKTMEEWLTCEASKNLMTKQFAGKRPQEDLEPEDLENALKAIDNFWFIGLMERYEQDVRHMFSLLGAQPGKILHHLKTAERIPKVYEHHYGNVYDLELYNYVKDKRGIT